MSMAYKDAGVNISAGNEAVDRIKNKVASTFSDAVLNQLGGFAGMIDLQQLTCDYKHPVLVQSIDGVGTKTIIARMMNKYDTLGIDVLSACCNDILVLGAKPITFLDYIAFDRLSPQIVEDLVSGMVQACREHDVALLGGETAEMPSIYLKDEIDLVGIVTGIVEEDKIIDGREIKPGHIVLGLLSDGLHTNGYSLARQLFFTVKNFSVTERLPELGCSLGEALLKPHLNYTNPVLAILQADIPIKGMAHITGGGFIENIPRVLPENVALEIKKDSWQVPAIFKTMQTMGRIEEQEMFRTFNMGIGFILIVNEQDQNAVANVMADFPQYKIVPIGRAITGNKEVLFI
jgi:phosphoribosylformylglycinamidine cyclo-ligase